MSNWVVILLGSLLMSLVALVGAITLVLPARLLQKLLAPLVSLAAGSLLGGALFHMLPEGFAELPLIDASTWVSIGFTLFLALEIFLNWHHSHQTYVVPAGSVAKSQPLPLLILLGDGLHNLVGGFGIASAYLIRPEAGVAAWLAAVAHEIPQELGDFGVLLQSGWLPRRALVWNFLSALTFPLGALLAWRFQHQLPLSQLVLFAAGNFLYVSASDLVPEIKSQVTLHQAVSSFGWFTSGLLLLWILASA